MIRPDPETQLKLRIPPSPAERRRIRRACVLAGVGFALFFLISFGTSRLGIWRDLPWLQTAAPGPFTPGWWLRSSGLALAAGLIFGYLLSKTLRLPHTPPEGNDQ